MIRAVTTASKITPDYEVIVVNDGSADSTAEFLEELARLYPTVRPVHHEKNRGYGAALRTGFETATKEFVFYTTSCTSKSRAGSSPSISESTSSTSRSPPRAVSSSSSGRRKNARLTSAASTRARAKLTATTGWKPTISLPDGLARAVAYYRAHLDRYR